MKRPWTVKIELVEGCNRLCEFCGINGIRTKPGDYKFMSERTARAVAKNLADFCPTARYEFEGHGEPLMHPDYLGMLSIFREALPNAQMQVTTNGKVLLHDTHRKMRDLLDIADFLIVDTYEPERMSVKNAIFDAALFAQSYRVYNYHTMPKKTRIHPYSNKHRKFNNAVIIMDDISQNTGETIVRKLHNAAGNSKMLPPLEKPLHKMCVVPFRELFIAHSGIVPLCCLDFGHEIVLGDAGNDIEQIWNGKHLQAIRRVLYGRYRGFTPCSVCSVHAGMRVGLVEPVDPPSVRDLGYIANAQDKTPANNKQPYIWPDTLGECAKWHESRKK